MMMKISVPPLPSLEEWQSFVCRPEVQAAGVVALTTGITIKVARQMWAKDQLKRKRELKRKQRDEIMKKWEEKLSHGKLSRQKQKEIVALSMAKLIEKLQTDKLKATEVLEAYQIEALKSHKRTNCIIEPILEAEQWAEECDKSSEKKGILHGVPISIKDNVGIKGYDSTLGCSQWAFQPVTEDAVIIKILKSHGAIPYVKTNVPQTMMSIDTSNPIFGRTTNPFDPSRSSGGSSGGEGALIGCGGSPLGIGSDIGGSIRVPSHFCGICGFKPTWARTSLLGTQSVTRGQNIIRGSYGPMARDVDSLVLAMRALLVPTMFQMDSSVPPVPFREEIYGDNRKLRIGYYSHDGFFTPTPAMQRGIMVAKQALEKQGHEMVPIEFGHIGKRAVYLYARTVAADGGKALLTALADGADTTDPVMKPLVLLCSLPLALKRTLSFLIKPLFPRIAFFLSSMVPSESISQWYQNVTDIEALRQQVVEEWKGMNLDGVVAPVYSAEALLNGLPGRNTAALSYAMTFNCLNFPAGSLPVTTTTVEDQSKMKLYPTSDPYEQMVKKSSSSGAVGLPVSVQVVTPPWEEELCLRVMKELESGLSLITNRATNTYIGAN